ncbi:hypothetical protein QJS66_05370 [Kocuria rhizophila]|nr:hypothetical protein QJS66_05370 [Kocuria rhizophila]
MTQNQHRSCSSRTAARDRPRLPAQTPSLPPRCSPRCSPPIPTWSVRCPTAMCSRPSPRRGDARRAGDVRGGRAMTSTWRAAGEDRPWGAALWAAPALGLLVPDAPPAWRPTPGSSVPVSPDVRDPYLTQRAQPTSPPDRYLKALATVPPAQGTGGPPARGPPGGNTARLQHVGA